MTRSKWKGVFVNPRIYNGVTPISLKLVPLKYRNREVKCYTSYRSSTITTWFVGARVAVLNGKRYHSFIVKPYMVGHKFGEFAITKKLGNIHIRKKKRR